MLNDLLSEQVFLLSDGPSRVHKSYESLYKYIHSGMKSVAGRTVHLESCVLEGGLATSVEAFQRFRRSLNDAEVKDRQRKKSVSVVRVHTTE